MTGSCPTCGRGPRATPQTTLRRALARVGGDWRLVRAGASRWYCRELRKNYPGFEWRHQRNGPGWDIYCRRGG